MCSANLLTLLLSSCPRSVVDESAWWSKYMSQTVQFVEVREAETFMTHHYTSLLLASETSVFFFFFFMARFTEVL